MQSQMPKQVRGMKRNQIIQQWLRGIEDPNYEVFPTKKEGKYIIKPRDTSIPSGEPVKKLVKDHSCDNLKEMDQDYLSRNEQMETPQRRDSTINLEILEQLRSLGEELRNDRFKKEQKQYIKHVVNKELAKPRIKSKYVPEMFPNEAIPSSLGSPSGLPQVEPQPTPQSEPHEEPALCAAYPSGKPQPVFRSRIRR